MSKDVIIMGEKKILSEIIADKLLELIKESYEPGEKIPNEMELAARFDVSRTTIREAVKQLSSRNIVKIKRGNGTFVCENSPNEGIPVFLDETLIDSEDTKKDIFEIFQKFQPVLASIAAEKASDESIALLRNMNDTFNRKLFEYRQGAMKGSPSHIINDFRHMDVEFHKAIAEACDNQLITGLIPAFIDRIGEFYKVWTVIDKDAVLDNCQKYHNLITYAIEIRDPDLAYRLSSEHEKAIMKLYLG